MLLPFGDYPNPRKPQWVTRILLGLNVAIYLLLTLPMSRPLTREELRDPDIRRQLDEMWKREAPDAGQWGRARLQRLEVERAIWERRLSRYAVFTARYGYVPGDPSLIALFTCMFLHAGFLHLAGNMLYLYIFGDNAEARLGPLGYLAAYLGTGVVATLSFAALESDSLTPLVGASGAISGVLGLYLVWFPHNQVRVLLFFLFIMVVHVPASVVLFVYVVISNLLPLLRGGGGNVAYGAHLGGFVAGMAVAFLYNRIRGPVRAPRPGAHVERRPPPWVRADYRVLDDPGRRFAQALERGDHREAALQFSRHVRDGGAPPEPALVFELGRWLYESDLVADAATVFRYYLAHYPAGADLDRVHLGLGVLLARRLGQSAAAREHLLSAIDVTDDPELAARARAEISAL